MLQGKKVNEIVSERWGSLTELTASLTERRAAHGEDIACSPILHGEHTWPVKPVCLHGWAARCCCGLPLDAGAASLPCAPS